MHKIKSPTIPLSKSQLLETLAAQEQEIIALKEENEMLKKNTALIPDSDLDVFSLKKIIALMPGNIFWKDKEGKYLGCNNNVAKFFGFTSPDDIIGKRNEDFIPVTYSDILSNNDKEIMDSKVGRHIEEYGIDAENNPAVFLTHKIPLCDRSGNVVGLLGIALNITEQKKLEEDLKVAKKKAEASSRAKSQFLAVMNHELRTPLTSIVGLVDFLKQDNLNVQEEKNIIEAIRNCTLHLLNLVNDVLDFSRLETGNYNLRVKPVNIPSLITEICNILNPLAKKKGLQISVQISPAVPENILADSRLLHQILINLMTNSIKFTENGQVTIKIDCLQQQANKAQLEIKIIDTGQGIPADKIDFIFEPFQQLEDAYTRQSSRSGTGLGLAIVKHLTSLIGATIKVDSKLEAGSIFSLIGEFETYQPVETPTKPFIVAKTAKKLPEKIYPNLLDRAPRVLLVEDDPIVRYIHKKMLTDLGCEVDAVSHGHEAINVLQSHDIVFVDISLPDINGFEVIRLIREERKLADVPIVALTVYSGKEEKSASLAAGANEFASKPISIGRLKKLLLKFLE